MARTDDEILVDVVDALIGDVRLDLRELNVHVSKGQVTLGGTAPDSSQRYLAEEVASKIKGVANVFNSLRVNPVPAISDEAIAQAVRESLSRDTLVPDDLVQVEAEHQVVRLVGSVDSLAARSSAEDDARLVRGVKDVINDLKVAPGLHRTDGEIASDVRASLLGELNLGASEIEVTVRDGMVELQGSVSNADLRRRVEEVARRTPGVLGVENNIVVIV